MIDRSYLLKYLRAGDRILLYGKGRNVQLNYEYLKGQSQFCVVGIITLDADQVIDAAIPMYDLGQLKTLPHADYDKVIITVRDQKLGIEMYQAVQESGVDPKKIVAAHIYVGQVTDISLEDLIGDRTRLRLEIEKFIRQNYGSIYYFDPLIQELRKRTNERAVLRQQWKEIAGLLPPLECIVLLYILYLADIFDAELMEQLMNSMLRVDEPQLRNFLYGMYYDIIAICFIHEEYLFPKYYMLRRTLGEKLCKMYGLQISKDQIKKEHGHRIRKICMLHGELMGPKHSPTLESIQISRILAELGYEVKVMPLDIRSNIMWDFPIFRPLYHLAYYGAREFEEFHKDAYHEDVSIEYTDIVDPREKMQDALDRITAFSPDLIIDMGVDNSLLSYAYAEYFLTVYLPMGGLQSSACFTYYVAPNHDGFVAANEVFHSVDPEKEIIFQPFPNMPRGQAKYERRYYPQALLNSADFVLISVGNRIGNELTENFVDIVCEKLLTKPNIKWLIVGGRNEYLSQRYQELFETRKITYIPYEDDLPALYQICDVYISPKRQGGGTSVFWAMYCGLPIAQAASLQADAITIMGPENTICETDEQVADYVLELWENPAKYAESSEKMRMRALHIEESQKQGWKDLIERVEMRNGK